MNQLFHGEPNYIPHYAKNKAKGTMKPGMVSLLLTSTHFLFDYMECLYNTDRPVDFYD